MWTSDTADRRIRDKNVSRDIGVDQVGIMFSLFRHLANRTLTIAHRGASSLAPENTLSAARKALETGADMWELDIRMAAGGQLVILHDATLSRTTNIERIDRFRDRHPWPLHQFTLAELKALDAGSWFIADDPFKQIRKGRIAENDMQRFRGETIPMLSEALAFGKANHFPVNIEIKDLSDCPDGEHVVEKLAGLIGEMAMTDQVLVSSFNHDYLVPREIEKRTARYFHCGPGSQ